MQTQQTPQSIWSCTQFTCDSGYHIEGSNTMTCLITRQWSVPLPTCQQGDASNCPTLQPPDNGNIDTTDTDVGAVVTITCNPGYTLTGSSRLTCLATGAWDPAMPTCTGHCPTLNLPDHLNADSNDTTVNTVVLFTCDSGYHIEGSNTMTCLITRRWSVSLPACQQGDASNCPALQPPANGNIDITDTAVGTVVTITCNSGYTLTGSSQLTCLARVTCNSGYTLTGSSRLTCLRCMEPCNADLHRSLPHTQPTRPSKC
jgi:CUB/sushi domain-containing protein